jgi:hypothetical protein
MASTVTIARRMSAAALKGTLLLTATLVLLVSTGDAAAQSDPCPVGEPRSVEPDLFSREKLLTAPFVVGCADLRHQGRMELIAYRLGRSMEQSAICVEIQWRNGSTTTCRDPTEKLHGLDYGLTALSRRWLHLSGFASPHVARVRLRYRSLGELRRPRGVLTRVTDPAVLKRLVLTEPFTYFTAEVSSRARSPLLLARNKAGKLVFWRSLPDAQDILNPKGGEVIGELPLPQLSAAPAASAIAR